MAESASGSAMSTEPDRIANVPRTGPSPNMCRVRNVTLDRLASIS
jgi:hypothetical protein